MGFSVMLRGAEKLVPQKNTEKPMLRYLFNTRITLKCNVCMHFNKMGDAIAFQTNCFTICQSKELSIFKLHKYEFIPLGAENEW